MILLKNKTFLFAVEIIILILFMWVGANEAFAATFDVTIQSNGGFSPSTVNINTGDTVRWTSTVDSQQVASDQHPSHTDYPDPPCPKSTNPGCFESPILFTDETYSFTFMIGGTWEYHNHQKPGRKGTIIVADLNVPDVVSDLAASNPTSSTVDLTWTSPGDDVGSTGNFGSPTTYDIRYSTSTITDANWASATQATGESTPSVAGFVESMTVTGLSSVTTYYFAMKTSDEVPNTSALSNVTSSTTTAPSGDTTPPAAVTDLALSNPTTSSIDLTWTSPGDDGNTGTAQSYDIRYSTALITEGNWSSATKVTGEPTPSVAGSSESMTVTGLSEGTTYYFAIKTSDEEPNVSALSNVPNLITLAGSGLAKQVYNIDLGPPAPVNDLVASSATASSIQLTWTASGDDENDGTARDYDIRYSTTIFTQEDYDFVQANKGRFFIKTAWSVATQVQDEPVPLPAGAKQSTTISGLASDTTYYFAMTVSDELHNTSNLSNIVSLPTSDLVAPAEILDLTFTTNSPTDGELKWSTPGDNVHTGVAAIYDVRYTNTESLTEENWSSAMSFINPPTPKEPGLEETFAVMELDHGTTYYIGIKTLDEISNESGLSNVISFTTPPAIEPLFNRPLRRGVENKDILRLQEVLAQDPELYPEGRITGFFGDATEAAVKRFQIKYGLEESGIVDLAMSVKLTEVFGAEVEPATREVFLRTLFIGMSGVDVRLLQEFLAKDPKLYPEGLITGFFGPLTDQAVGRLQVKYGILPEGDPVLGYVGPKTRAKLNELFTEPSGTPSLEEAPTMQETLLQDIQKQIKVIQEQIKDIQKQLDTFL